MQTRMVSISSCAEVQAGFSVKGALVHEEEGSHQVVMSKHLTPGEPYRYSKEDELRITPDRAVEKYRLVPGDILFMSRGVGNYAVLLEDVPDDSIASLTFFILRSKPHVDPGYLAWCLNQRPFQEQIANVRTGAGTPMVPRNVFNELEIPLRPFEEQHKITRLAHLFGKEQRLLRQLTEATQLRQRLLGIKIMTGQIRGYRSSPNGQD